LLRFFISVCLALGRDLLFLRWLQTTPIMLTLNHYLALSFVLFSIGVAGVLLRRNILIVLMSLELVFNSVNISLAAFSYYLQSLNGMVFVVFSITIAAAEVAVGLAILVAVFRRRKTVDVDELNEMRW
jgi:NADH-quinone oxidoreductase subunit K